MKIPKIQYLVIVIQGASKMIFFSLPIGKVGTSVHSSIGFLGSRAQLSVTVLLPYQQTKMSENVSYGLGT